MMAFGKYGQMPIARAVEMIRKRWINVMPEHISLYCLGDLPKFRLITYNHKEHKYVPDKNR